MYKDKTDNTTIATTYHVPVLLGESVDGLNIKPGGIYVDVTFGGGGHSREILSRLTDGAHLYSFDQDADAERNIPDAGDSFTFVRSNFRYLKNWMRYYGVEHIDGLLADLGVSSHHFDDAERGFSFRFDAPLDMRMNKRAGRTAAEIVNTYDEERLADIFYVYGEMKNSRRRRPTSISGDEAHTSWLLQQESDYNTPESQLEWKEDEQWLRQRIEQLPPREMQVMRLRQTERRTNEQIAAILGISKDSVATMLSSARRKLFNQIKERNRTWQTDK